MAGAPADWTNATPRDRRLRAGRPRGILRHPAAPGAFHHARLAPASRLAHLVEHFWIVRWDLGGGDPQVREVLPHPNVHWVVERGRSRIYGVQTGRFTTTLEGTGGVFGIKFRPGAFRALLGRSVSTIRNRRLAPADIFGAAAGEVEAAVTAAGPDDEAMAAAAEAFLTTAAREPDDEAVRAGALVDAIAHDRETTRVEQLAARAGLSVRALQRLFTDYVGVGPKWVINRYRLHEALERLSGGTPVDWAALSLELGYFDQAHFIRDFKALVGCTPGKYVSR